MKCLMRPEACRFQSTVVGAPGPALSVRIGSVEYDAVVYQFLIYFRMQEEREAKQKYLTQTILEQGYVAEDFAQYCQKMCGNVDIDNWTLRDLENIVIGYVDHKQQAQNEKPVQSVEPDPNQTSFVVYQQGEEKPQHPRPPSPAVRNNRPQSPIKQVYREPPKAFKKESWKVDTFDNPPSPVRPSVQNKVKLAPAEKINLDQLFKDPFKKKPTKQPGEWDSNVWVKPPEKQPASNFSKEFNFDEFLSKPVESTAVKSSPKPDKISTTPVQPLQPVQKLVLKPEVKKEKQKPVGNPGIFEIDFTDVKDLHTPRKPASSHSQPKHDAKVQPLKAEVPVPKADQPFKIDWKNTKPNTAQNTPTHTKPVQINLYASHSPNLNESKKKTRQEGARIVQEDWYDIVKCIKAKTRQLALKPNLEIVITGHEIVNRNVFMPDYVRYFVSTPALNSEVKRKYNHFVKLRANLEKFYPGFRMPYLAKGAWYQTDPSNIATQKTIITHFMNDVLMNRELRNCRIVEQFLTLKDYKGLKVKFEQYEKMGTLHAIEELCLLPGQVNVGYSEAHRVFIDKLPIFIHSMQSVFQKYKKLLDQLTYNHQALQRTLTELAETTLAMETLAKTFNSSVEIGECYELEGTLKLINKLYKELDKQSKFDMDLVETDLKPFFRYEKDNLGTIRDIISQKSRFQQSFNPNSKSEKKQNYVSPSLDQYKVRISDPSKNLTVLRYQHGYFSNQVVMETKQMLSSLSDKLSNRFGQFCHDYQQRSAEYTTFWGNIKGAISLPVVG